MDTCSYCRSPLEWHPQRTAARCTGCAALYTPTGAPLRVESPMGGFDPGFQAAFEEQLGFSPRIVPPTPPPYFGPGPAASGGGFTPSAPTPASSLQRTIQIGIGLFVFGLLGMIGLYVAYVLYTSIPH